MPKFEFRLDKLLDYRKLQEKWAKDEYLACRAKRIEGELRIEEIQETRRQAVFTSYAELSNKLAQESYVQRLDDEQRAVEAAVAVLVGEEDAAKDKWIEAKQNAEALEKIKDKDLQEWLLEEDRREQREIDEWAVTRRAA